jgi:hypothetical protein
MTDDAGTSTTGGSVTVNGPAGMSATEMTGLVGLFNSQLSLMETRIMARLDLNAEAARHRWETHDKELAENTRRVVERFEKLEANLTTVAEAVRVHHEEEHDERVRNDARVRPVKGFFGWLWRNWRDLVLLAIGLLALAAAFGEWFGRFAGPHLP